MLINPHQMIKPETTLLFHDKKVYIFLMIWVDCLTRQGRKLQLPFMCCLAPFPGRIAPFPALPFSSGTGSAAPGDQTEHCGSGRGNAKARVNAPLSPSPTSPGARPSGRRQASQFCPGPADQIREAGERRGASRQGGRQAGRGLRCRLPPRLQPAPHAQEPNAGGDDGDGGTWQGETLQSLRASGETGETDPGSPGGSSGSASGPRCAPHLLGTPRGSRPGAGQRAGAERSAPGRGRWRRRRPWRAPRRRRRPGAVARARPGWEWALPAVGHGAVPHSSSSSPGACRRQRPSRVGARRTGSLGRSGGVGVPAPLGLVRVASRPTGWSTPPRSEEAPCAAALRHKTQL